MAKPTSTNPEPLGQINSAEAAALTIIRGIPPDQRQAALEWFRSVAQQREIRDVVLQAMARYAQGKSGSDADSD